MLLWHFWVSSSTVRWRLVFKKNFKNFFQSNKIPLTLQESLVKPIESSSSSQTSANLFNSSWERWDSNGGLLIETCCCCFCWAAFQRENELCCFEFCCSWFVNVAEIERFEVNASLKIREKK